MIICTDFAIVYRSSSLIMRPRIFRHGSKHKHSSETKAMRDVHGRQSKNRDRIHRKNGSKQSKAISQSKFDNEIGEYKKERKKSPSEYI